MMALTLGEAAATALARVAECGRGGIHAGARRQGRAPVRRGSSEAGTFEDRFFTVPAKGDCDRMLRACRDALDAGRRLRREARAGGAPLDGAGRAIAALTAGAVRVFEELCALARVNNGRVYPSYDRLAAATALGRATVARALDLLERAGFLVRRRRFVRVEGERAGPRYAQTSNAYRPTLPAGLARLLPRWRLAAPVPDDTIQHMTAQRHATEAMRETLSCRELARATADGKLGQALARLGSLLDARGSEGTEDSERESHNRSGIQPSSLNRTASNHPTAATSR